MLVLSFVVAALVPAAQLLVAFEPVDFVDFAAVVSVRSVDFVEWFVPTVAVDPVYLTR